MQNASRYTNGVRSIRGAGSYILTLGRENHVQVITLGIVTSIGCMHLQDQI